MYRVVAFVRLLFIVPWILIKIVWGNAWRMSAPTPKDHLLIDIYLFFKGMRDECNATNSSRYPVEMETLNHFIAQIEKVRRG